jgi:hypothetical protein
LWKLLDAGDENLLFKKNDMEAPAGSAAFKMLESISDENVRLLTAAFRKTLGVQDISLVPPLTIGKLKQGKIKWIPDTLTPKPQLEAPNWTDWVPGFLPQQKPIESLKPSFSEHVLYKLLILLGFYLSYSLFTKNGIDISAAYAFSAGMPSALILSVIRFLKSPEKVNKKEKLLEIKKKRIEFKEAEKDHKRLTEKRDSYNSEHNSKLLSADSKQKLLLQNEVTEVEKISAPLKSKIARLKTQIQQLNREESDAVNQALQGFVKDYMSNKLSNHDLASVSIQGIGVELKRQLSAHGVKTFGDIIDVSVNYVQHGRFTNSIVQIQVKGRGNVKVPGIGLKKGETLLRYKKSLEQSYLSNAPKTPPSHVLDTIRKPFIIKRNTIDTDEQEAQKLLVQEVNRIHQSYAKQIEECSKELIILKSGTEREFKELSWKAEQAEKLTQKKKAEIEQMEKGFKIYSPITFSSYIRRAFIA